MKHHLQDLPARCVSLFSILAVVACEGAPSGHPGDVDPSSGNGGDGGAGPSSGNGGDGGAGSMGSTGTTGGGSSADPDEALLVNDVFWKDSSGTPIYSQGGGVLKVGSTYYWYGVKYKGAVTYAANPTEKNDEVNFVSVTAYSSEDLVHWKFEGDVLKGEIGWFGRLGVVYNALTKKYVLVAQGRGGLYFATSETPTGPFTFDNVQTNLPGIVNGSTGDQTTFQDDDGKAYLICSSSMGRANLYVVPLRASDFLAIETPIHIYKGPGREGNAMFKYDDKYYFCSSDLHGWNASHAYCMSATNILGPYSSEFVIDNTDPDFSHVTQTGFFITVHGTQQSTVIFAGDRWADFAGNGIGYNQWMPLTFPGGVPRFESPTEWWLNAKTGTWRIGEHNNYVRNPTFEADRVAISQPAGWTTTSKLEPTPHSNGKSGRTGRWFWQIWQTSSYEGTLEQLIPDLPNGKYRLSAWVKSSGGQASASLYAKDFGGGERTTSLAAAYQDWTKISVSGIEVTSGQARIGVTTKASADQWLNLDDFELVKE